MSTPENEFTMIGKVTNYYGGLNVSKMRRNTSNYTYFMHIENHDGMGEGEEISESLYNELIRHNNK